MIRAGGLEHGQRRERRTDFAGVDQAASRLQACTKEGVRGATEAEACSLCFLEEPQATFAIQRERLFRPDVLASLDRCRGNFNVGRRDGQVHDDFNVGVVQGYVHTAGNFDSVPAARAAAAPSKRSAITTP